MLCVCKYGKAVLWMRINIYRKRLLFIGWDREELFLIVKSSPH